MPMPMTAPAATAIRPRESLHRRILTDIETKIVSGEWPPGTQIPFEQDLATQYGCSRMTVNKVMTQLVAARLIERRRKAGSFVKRPQSYSAVLEIVDIKREVEALGLPYHFEIIRSAKRRSTKTDEARLELPASADMIEIVCRHFAGRQPFCIEERIINLAAVPEAGSETFDAMPPGAWLIARVPWTAAEHKIRAIGAGSEISAALLIPEGTPCLRIERRTWSAAEPITFVRLVYPGDGQEIVAHFAPSQSRG